MKFLDPRTLTKDDLPLICLADDRRGLLGFLIKTHSQGNYNHVMEMHLPDLFASQHFTGYKEIPIEKYMKPFILLKFWKVKNLTENERETWLSAINMDLDAPWLERRYDILGLLGQLLHIPWLNNPWTKYCSERIAEHLRYATDMGLKHHPNPSELNDLFKKIERMSVAGYWWGD